MVCFVKQQTLTRFLFEVRVHDLEDQIQELYLGVFAAPSATIENIVQSAYKKGSRTAHSTLNTIWIGINDIGLTFGWENTTAIDKEIMIRYASLIVC